MEGLCILFLFVDVKEEKSFLFRQYIGERLRAYVNN